MLFRSFISKKKINPWILNDKGETTFQISRQRKYPSQCRACSESISKPGGAKCSISALSEPRESRDTLMASSSTSVNQECNMSQDVNAESSLKETQSSLPMITCKWCKKEKPCKDFEQVRKTERYHIACNSCRQLDCKFCGCSFKSKSRAADPPHYPVCEANECKRKSAIKSRNCSNASCIYHKRKINPWILNDNGETTFKPTSRGHFSAQCRRCQQMSDVKKGS